MNALECTHTDHTTFPVVKDLLLLFVEEKCRKASKLFSKRDRYNFVRYVRFEYRYNVK